MLVSHRKKFIYTKTEKTAGTSVESYFEKYCMPKGAWEFAHSREEYVSEKGIIGYRGNNARENKWYNHMPAIEIRDKIGSSIWSKYFKFCVIRNPFDKLVSGFFFQQKKLKEFFKEEVMESKDLTEAFKSWIKNGGFINDRDKYFVNGGICVDYFIRYENLKNDIEHVCYILSIPFEPESLPKLKAGFRIRKIPLIDFYDEKTIQIVCRRYKFELEYFNYSIPTEAK
jgi:hypothetical protein